jgi:HK97 gp10 family phage protein
MQNKADFKGHWGWEKGKGKIFKKPTGKTKDSIKIELKDSGLTAEVGPETHYSPYVEYGTRKMEAQPFIHPAFEEEAPKFINRMQKLVK